MASTKRTLSDQILRRLSGGNTKVAQKVHPLEIDKAIEQVLNSLLRPQHFETMNAGGTEVETSLLCVYDNIPVTSLYNGYSKCILPAIPVTLIKGQGVHRVYATESVSAFIPATSGEMEMLASQTYILSDVLGQVAYKQRGGELVFNRDLPALSPAIDTVSIELVVVDFSQFGDYDILPINAEMEGQVVDTVYKMFAGVPLQPQVVDPTSDSK